MEYYYDSLTHYGVLGMKWGVTKKQESSSRESGTPEKKKSKHRLKLEEKYRAKGMSQEDAERKARNRIRAERIAIGTTAVVAAVGVYKLADSGELQRLAEKGKAFLQKDAPKWARREALADPNLTPDSIFSQVVSRINTDHNVKGISSVGTNANCLRCTYAYELSRRGFDVQATKTINGTGQSVMGVYNATNKTPIKGGLFGTIKRILSGDESVVDYLTKVKEAGVTGVNKIELDDKDPAKAIFNALSGNPNGARGSLSMNWKSGFGHSMAWEIIDRKPVIFDCQTQEMFDSIEKLTKDAGKMAKVGFTRLDNLELNNDFLLRWVKNFG